ncbi:MAG: sodium:solute symporter family transporter, partial [Gammaproteobacteria bacterium]
WYWCTDQFIVQRVLAAKNIEEARRGAIFAGVLKLLPLFIFVVPGIIAHVLASRGELVLSSPDAALPTLVSTLLPEGLRGLVVAGLLAALMSSLSSVFNSCSTLVTWDVYRKLKPQAPERELVVVGQIATLVMVGFGLAWIPMMKLVSGQLYQYLQSVQAYISPPIAAVFLIGIFWARVNSQGALAALLTGFVLGMSRLLLELNRDLVGDGWLGGFVGMNFLHFAIFLFVICAAVLILVSLATPAPDAAKIDSLTVGGSRSESAPVADAGSRHTDILASIGLIALVGAIWWIFS